MEKKVTIELTDAQKEKLKKDAGLEINSLTYDALEDRFAPKGKSVFKNVSDQPVDMIE